jgi:hypothetical protein
MAVAPYLCLLGRNRHATKEIIRARLDPFGAAGQKGMTAGAIDAQDSENLCLLWFIYGRRPCFYRGGAAFRPHSRGE